jgi:cysteine-rich repeat protein
MTDDASRTLLRERASPTLRAATTVRLAAAVVALVAAAAGPAGAQCVLGNGQAEFGEECDGHDFAGLGCQDLCFDSGVLLCTGGCTIDTSRCFVCGDDTICDGDPSTTDPGCNEVCDGTSLGAAACGDGFDPAESGGGTLRCNPLCLSHDRTGCFRCGNGVKDGTREVCDGLDFGGRTCGTYGWGGDAQHTLRCATACGQVLVDDCFRCGNGRIDPGEECDAGQANGEGYCDPSCRTRCGDGAVEWPEECDDGSRQNGDGCSSQCLVEGTTGGGCHAGGTGCTATDPPVTPAIDRCWAAWGIGGFAVVPVTAGLVAATCRKGDPCDATPTGPDCTFRYFLCLNTPQFGSGTCAPPGAGIAEIGSTTTALLTAARAAFGGTIAGSSLIFSPPLAQSNRCVGTELALPPGATRTVRVDTRSAGTSPLVDHDELTFGCTARLSCDPETENCEP